MTEKVHCTPSLEKTVSSFLLGVRKSDSLFVTKAIVKYVAGFMYEDDFDDVLRLKTNYLPNEIEAFKNGLHLSRYMAARETILDIFHYKTERQQATKENIAQDEDISFILHYLELDSLTNDDCVYELPGAFDIKTQRVREKHGALIDVPSGIGVLIENWLEDSTALAKDYVTLRKHILSYIKAEIDQIKLNELTKDCYKGICFHQLIFYIQNFSELIQKALIDGKTEVELINDDIEYLKKIAAMD